MHARDTPGPSPTLLPCRIRRGWGWVACHPLSLPSPPRFWPRMPGALGLSAGSQTSCSVRPTTQRHGNSLSHLILAVSTSLQQAPAEPSLLGLNDASLQAFALMLGNWDESCPYGADSSPGLACLVTTVGDMSSVVCQSSQGSCLGQLPCRQWSVLPKLGRPGSSSRVFIGLCPLPAGPGAPLALLPALGGFSP